MILGDPHAVLEAKQAARVLASLMDALPDRERVVLEMRFGFEHEPQTLDAVGQAIGVSREQVRQIEAKALKKLQHPAKLDRLRESSSEAPARRWQPPPRREVPAPLHEAEKFTALVLAYEQQKPRYYVSPKFSEWLDQLRAQPRIGEVGSWEPIDFAWPFNVGMTPERAIEFAIRFEACPSVAAKNALCVEYARK